MTKDEEINVLMQEIERTQSQIEFEQMRIKGMYDRINRLRKINAEIQKRENEKLQNECDASEIDIY